MDDAVEPFGSDDVEFSADDVFDSDDDELSEPDELDFEINDLDPVDDDDDDDAVAAAAAADDEYAVLFELNRQKQIENFVCSISIFKWILPGRLVIGARYTV